MQNTKLGLTGRKEILRWSEKPTFRLKKGILQYKIPYGTSFRYYLVFSAGYAEALYDAYIETKEKKYKINFLYACDWLLDNGEKGVHYQDFSLPFYQFPAEWISGLGQALSVSALLRAFQISGQKEYFDGAVDSATVFKKEIGGGGVIYRDESNSVWLEEYAIHPAPQILNGFISILISLHELSLFTKKFEKIRKDSLDTLEKNLHNYDIGYFTRYDLLNKYPSTILYHKIHIKQMKQLYELTGRKIFFQFAKKWSTYLTTSNIIRSKMTRGVKHLDTHGIIGCLQRARERRRWKYA